MREFTLRGNSILPPVTEERGSASEPSQVTELVSSSALPVSDSPDIAVISELGDREDRIDSPTSADLVPSQRIQLPTNSVPDSSPSPLSDTVADSDWGYEEPASSCALERFS